MKASIDARIQRLLPIARRLITVDGMNPANVSPAINIPEPSGLTEKQVEQLIDWADEHYMLGVAVGLCLDASVFLKGGKQ